MRLEEYKTKYIAEIYASAKTEREKGIADILITKIYNLGRYNAYDLAFTLYIATKEAVSEEMKKVIENALRDLQSIEW
ncbi:MAG: hypothetical protein C0179_00790 [Fervidicoccus sp.]|nr:MAG: hypothetical protein C0179_00790 [Fervidicoccus sp.]